MLLDASFLNELLGGDVASREKNGSRHTLGQQWASSELRIIPRFEISKTSLLSLHKSTLSRAAVRI